MSHDLTADRIILANIRRAAMNDAARADQQAADTLAAARIAAAEAASARAERAREALIAATTPLTNIGEAATEAADAFKKLGALLNGN